MQTEGISCTASIPLEFNTLDVKFISLTGNLSLVAINQYSNQQLLLRLQSDASTRTLTFPGAWRWIGSAAPANIAANKVALLWLWSFGTQDTDIIAHYFVQHCLEYPFVLWYLKADVATWMSQNMDSTGGEGASVDPWQVQQLRFTGFLTSACQVSSEGFFKSVVGEEPATSVFERKKGVSIEQGSFQGGTLGLQVQPRRIDGVLVQDTEKQPTSDENSFDIVGPFAALTASFRETMVKWLNHDLSLKRIAFGAVLLAPVDNRQEGYQRLVPFLPNVKLDPIHSSDLLYQINRPTESKEMPKLVVNRLTKWGVIQLLRNQLAISLPVNQQAGPISGSWVPVAEPICACRLELDISTSGEFENELPKAKLGLIFEELVEYGKVITQKGDSV